MALTEGRFVMPELWWDCRRGTPRVPQPNQKTKIYAGLPG